jgi:dTDP-4-dehydrorhamnose reductase
MKILVAGADGQLGRSLPEALRDHEVVACSRKTLDIANAENVAEIVGRHRPDIVVNAAAWNQVDRSETDIAAAYRTNAIGPRNLAVATAACQSMLVHVSTDYVFDGETGRPYVETDTPRPRSVYGASKLAGEEAVRRINPRHHIVRTAWVFHEQGNNFPRTMIRLAANGPLRVVDDQIGSPTYAPHLAEGIARLMTQTAYGTWHMAGRGETSWFHFTRALLENLKIDVEVSPVSTEAFPRPAHRPAYAPLSTSRNPPIELPSWQEGLATFCAKLGEEPQG